MVILGLTGSIAMGKTVAADDFRRLGVPVFDADAQVHDLLGPGGAAVGAVAAAFPGVKEAGAIDRPALAKKVFGDEAALKRLEAILHPLVRRRQQKFLRRHRARRASLVVVDVPLLFETGGDARCDAVAVVSAPAHVQRKRVLARPGMTLARFRSILAKQMPDAAKRRLARFVVPTGLGRAVSLRAIKNIIKVCRTPPPTSKVPSGGPKTGQTHAR